jgi:hypothetical protein
MVSCDRASAARVAHTPLWHNVCAANSPIVSPPPIHDPRIHTHHTHALQVVLAIAVLTKAGKGELSARSCPLFCVTQRDATHTHASLVCAVCVSSNRGCLTMRALSIVASCFHWRVELMVHCLLYACATLLYLTRRGGVCSFVRNRHVFDDETPTLTRIHTTHSDTRAHVAHTCAHILFSLCHAGQCQFVSMTRVCIEHT